MPHPSPDFLALQSALAGEYSLQRELGRGGMGVVYLARDVQLDRDVAIKVLPTHLAQHAASRERFLREARTAAGLSHPHIVPIHRVGEAGGFVFFVMTFVDGETLGERLRTRGPLPHAEAARVLREVAWALAYAHGRGIVHRDVKPDNILLEASTGRALVTDFGIAHGGGESDGQRDAGLIMGTANFMSPEQAANAPVDARSDLYALGVVGFLAVSGRLPFETQNAASQNAHTVMVRQATEAPPAVSRVAPGLPSSLAAVIDRCLERDPARRFGHGEAMAAALAPSTDTKPALPPMLRAWLGARNPLMVPYLGWFGAFGALTTANLIAWVTGNRPAGFGDIPLLASIASLPLLPIIGFHLNQAQRQFRAGHTLADLRSALEIARREREESESLTREKHEGTARRLLRVGTVLSATWLAVSIGLLMAGVIHENRRSPQVFGVSLNIFLIFTPVLSTMLLGAISNALDVQFIPNAIRKGWQTGLRDRLWNSKVGNWLAKRLGAPEQSRAVGGGVFRATEAALGLAVSELFAALPSAFRENLEELPATVAALEATAAAARAELDVVAALAPSGSADAALLDRRRSAATTQLGASVAALEGIRLDLLRLHSGANDLAPLTTLIESARQAGDDIKRLAEAQGEVADALRV
ncbi:MAG: serine/threonine protein kinase [Gemmatimonadaceae bacterium]|nr:serine/threonine protein kinase [Gemmatimonadaceae bacterium]